MLLVSHKADFITYKWDIAYNLKNTALRDSPAFVGVTQAALC